MISRWSKVNNFMRTREAAVRPALARSRKGAFNGQGAWAALVASRMANVGPRFSKGYTRRPFKRVKGRGSPSEWANKSRSDLALAQSVFPEPRATLNPN